MADLGIAINELLKKKHDLNKELASIDAAITALRSVGVVPLVFGDEELEQEKAEADKEVAKAMVAGRKKYARSEPTSVRKRKSKIAKRQYRAKKRTNEQMHDLTQAVFSFVKKKAPNKDLAVPVSTVAQALYREYSKDEEDIKAFTQALGAAMRSMHGQLNGLMKFKEPNKTGKQRDMFYWKN